MKIPKVSGGLFKTLFVSCCLLLQVVAAEDSRNNSENYGKNGYKSSSEEQDKIWRGVDSSKAFPFYVAIMLRNSTTGKFGINCGGSLIDETTVLSAAHCTTGFDANDDLEAWLAPIDITQEPPQRIRIVAAETIDSYDPLPNVYNDIGVYKLEKPADLNDDSQVSTICIGKYRSYDNIRVELVGFGSMACAEDRDRKFPTRLQYARGSTISAGKCPTTRGNENKVNQVCAKLKDPAGRQNYAEQGKGDSGGPLFFKIDGGYSQVGLVSYNIAKNGDKKMCPDPNYPGAYTIPGRYEDFIRSNSRAQFC